LLRANQAYLIFLGAMVNGVTSLRKENERPTQIREMVPSAMDERARVATI
jgi:hypothetical protein